eukprot:scaffold32528_cov171-Skeletonema_menzelii.AAC.3
MVEGGGVFFFSRSLPISYSFRERYQTLRVNPLVRHRNQIPQNPRRFPPPTFCLLIMMERASEAMKKRFEEEL